MENHVRKNRGKGVEYDGETTDAVWFKDMGTKKPGVELEEPEVKILFGRNYDGEDQE